MGHTRIAVPATANEARWTNLAPGAIATASSSDHKDVRNIINRRAKTEASFENWRSQAGQPSNGQWLQLTFPVPIDVASVRLYGPAGDGLVRNALVQLFSDSSATSLAASAPSGPILEGGTDVGFQVVRAMAVRVTFIDVTGAQATLAEVEVIAAGAPVDQ
jgi:hypothetical protein